MQRFVTSALAALAIAAPATAAVAPATAAELQREKFVVDEQAIPVSNRDEIKINASRTDDNVKNRELWYARYTGSWGEWQKHGLNFARESDIVWAPPEGHWRIYLRIEDISGLAMAAPGPETRPSSEFIIDRTSPQAEIVFPVEGSMLRGGQAYTVTWKVADPHLHSTPITLMYSRTGDDAFVTVAERLPNSGAFEWTTPQDMTATGKLRLTAADKALNLGSAMVSNLVIDAIAPSRNILGPGIVAARQVDVAVRATDAGPAGMASVALFYSTDDGATWTPGPVLSEGPYDTIPFTAPTDGRYLLYLVATDKSGNASPAPKGKSGGTFSLLVDTEQPTVALGTPSGIRATTAKAAGAGGRIVYKPGDQVQVALQVKDANPKADGVSVFFQPQDGARWEQIGSSLPFDQPFTFAIPDLATTSARVKVSAIDVAGNQGEMIAEETIEISNTVKTGTVDIEL